MAMDIISKDKKEIQWRGLPQTSLNDIEKLKSERLGLKCIVDKKAAYLQELEDQYEGLQNLIQRNEQLYSSGDAPSGGVALPFILVQLLKEKGILPELSPCVENIVCSLDRDLQGVAAAIATKLRGSGQSVDLVLENKPLKWVFKRAKRVNAARLIFVGADEWQKGMVGVKNLSTGEQYEIKVDELE